jgi:hypothetical protein
MIVSGMTGRDIARDMLIALPDQSLRRLLAIAERRCLERPDDVKEANFHAMIVAEVRRREASERRAA